MKSEQNISTFRHSDKSATTNYTRIALFLILLGMVFGVETHLRVHILYRMWPLVLTVWGGGFIGIYIRRQRREAMFLSLGIFSIFFSLIALYCNFTGWDVLARIWPTFVGFLSLTFLFLFMYHKRRPTYLMLGLFLGLLAIGFFLVFYLSSSLWWTIFPLVGLSILIAGRLR